MKHIFLEWCWGYIAELDERKRFYWSIEDITQWWEDMNFMFEWQEHRIHIFKLACNVFVSIARYWWLFSKDFWPLCEDFRKFSKTCLKVTNVAGHFSKISKDYWILSKTLEEDPMKSLSYIKRFKYNLRNKLDISEIINIFTSEDMKNMPHESQTWLCLNFTSGVLSSETLVSKIKKVF